MTALGDSSYMDRQDGVGSKLMLCPLYLDDGTPNPYFSCPDANNRIVFDEREDYLAINTNWNFNTPELIDDSKVTPTRGELDFLQNFDGMRCLRAQQLHPTLSVFGHPFPPGGLGVKHLHQIILIDVDGEGFDKYYIASDLYHFVRADMYRGQPYNKKFSFMYEVLDTGVRVDVEGNAVFSNGWMDSNEIIRIYIVKKNVPWDIKNTQYAVRLAEKTDENNKIRNENASLRTNFNSMQSQYNQVFKEYSKIIVLFEGWGETRRTLDQKFLDHDVGQYFGDQVKRNEELKGLIDSQLPLGLAKAVGGAGEVGKIASMSPVSFVGDELKKAIDENSEAMFEIRAAVTRQDITKTMLAGINKREPFIQKLCEDCSQLCAEYGLHNLYNQYCTKKAGGEADALHDTYLDELKRFTFKDEEAPTKEELERFRTLIDKLKEKETKTTE